MNYFTLSQNASFVVGVDLTTYQPNKTADFRTLLRINIFLPNEHRAEFQSH